ncbi:MAG TPA: STAS domain-containing protein [Tepidisphaeraceae bacterium]|jgi:anti-sigma B factor antagonist
MANLERSNIDGVTVLRLRGSLNQGAIADVEKSFRDATQEDGAAIVLDLTNVDILTTPAISMFLDAARAIKHTGGRIVATGPQPRVNEVLRRLRLDTLLPVCTSIAEGIQRVKNGGAPPDTPPHHDHPHV